MSRQPTVSDGQLIQPESVSFLMGFTCSGDYKEGFDGITDDFGCADQCIEISYFESGLEMCCKWD